MLNLENVNVVKIGNTTYYCFDDGTMYNDRFELIVVSYAIQSVEENT
jgi:hypothetical protein